MVLVLVLPTSWEHALGLRLEGWRYKSQLDPGLPPGKPSQEELQHLASEATRVTLRHSMGTNVDKMESNTFLAVLSVCQDGDSWSLHHIVTTPISQILANTFEATNQPYKAKGIEPPKSNDCSAFRSRRYDKSSCGITIRGWAQGHVCQAKTELPRDHEHGTEPWATDCLRLLGNQLCLGVLSYIVFCEWETHCWTLLLDFIISHLSEQLELSVQIMTWHENGFVCRLPLWSMMSGKGEICP